MECNHATLAGRSFEHEVATAAALGIFGSVDANRGDPQNGWETDRFPNDVGETALALYLILRNGGFKGGSFNFDSKVRRQSVDPADLFHVHIGCVDTPARGLLIAARMIEDEALSEPLAARYADWDGAPGKSILRKRASLASLADLAVSSNPNPKPRSGKQYVS
jgi:xylose isomerase